MNPNEPLRVSKIIAARTQLRTAISFWFTDDDPVSVHTLAYAAHEIIHRLFRNRGLSGLMFDSMEMTKEEREAFILDLKETANFFKHANRDASEEGSIVFNPYTNELYIGACISGLVRMGLALFDGEWAFCYWRAIHDRRRWSSFTQFGWSEEVLNNFAGLNREQFFPFFITQWRARYGTEPVLAPLKQR